MDTLQANFIELFAKPEIAQMICDKLCDNLLPTLQAKFSTFIDTSLAELKARLEAVEKKSAVYEERLEQMDGTVKQLEKRLNDMERYSRRDSLVFHGIKSASYSEAAATQNLDDSEVTINTAMSSPTTEETLLKFLNGKLGVKVTANDISVAHRLPSRMSAPRTAAASQAPPPIVCKFTNRKIRDSIIRKRKDVKAAGYYINEHLTQLDSQIFQKARALLREKRIASCWTYNGITFIKKRETDTPMKVFTIGDLTPLDGRRITE